MDTWAVMFLFVGVGAFILGTIVGYKYAMRSIDRRIEELQEKERLRKKRILHDSGRRLPARENAGPPIVIQRIRFRHRRRAR